jgi:cell division protein FtsZ
MWKVSMKPSSKPIKIIGIGKYAIDAIDCIDKKLLSGAEFIAVSTSHETLHRCRAETKLGFSNVSIRNGAVNPLSFHTQLKVAEGRKSIKGCLAGAEMVIVVLGISRVTDIIISTIVASTANELSIPSLAIVIDGATINHSIDVSLQEFRETVDAFIEIPDVYPFGQLHKFHSKKSESAFLNNVLLGLIVDIVDYTKNGYINIDFDDFAEILSNSGKALAGSATASGKDRACLATTLALDGMEISGARRVLLLLTSNDSLKLKELFLASECIQLASQYALVYLSSVYDETMGDDLRVTVLATGLSVPQDCDYSGVS